MNLLKKSLLPIVVSSILLCANSVIYAADTEALNSGKGKIEYVDFKGGELVVEDVAFTLGPGYKVKNSAGKTISAFNLTKGRQVKVLYTQGNTVKEIIILK